MRIFPVSASMCMSLSLVCSFASIVSSDCENWDPRFYGDGFKYDEMLAAKACKVKPHNTALSFKLASLKLHLQSLGKSDPEKQKELRKEIREEYAKERAKKQASEQKKTNTSTPQVPNGRTAPVQATQAGTLILPPYVPVFFPAIYVPCDQAFFIQPLPTGIGNCPQENVWRNSSDEPFNKHQKFIDEQPPAIQNSLLQWYITLHKAYCAQVLDYANMQHQRNF